MIAYITGNFVCCFFLITELWRNSEAQMISKEVALRKSSAEVRSDKLVTPA